jgi:hypothetical protein
VHETKRSTTGNSPARPRFGRQVADCALRSAIPEKDLDALRIFSALHYPTGISKYGHAYLNMEALATGVRNYFIMGL